MTGNTEMFIRFVTDCLDEDTGIPSGAFSATYRILDGTEIDDYCRDEIRKTLDWFKTNLPIPDRFTRSRKPNRQDQLLIDQPFSKENQTRKLFVQRQFLKSLHNDE